MTTDSFMAGELSPRRFLGQGRQAIEQAVEAHELRDSGVELLVPALVLDAPQRAQEEGQDLVVGAPPPGLDRRAARRPVVPAAEEVVDPDEVGDRDLVDRLPAIDLALEAP